MKEHAAVGDRRLTGDGDGVAEGRDLPRDVRGRLYRKVVEHYAQRLGFTPAATETATLKELYLFGREMRRA